jgi:hypothetical protein
MEINRTTTKLRRNLEQIQADLARMEQETQQNAVEADHLAAALTAVYQDSPETVAPRQTFPKKHLSGWGSMRRTILAILRDANGTPLLKSEIAAELATRLGIDLAAPGSASSFSALVQKTLKGMARAGYVQRLHDPAKPQEGIWELKATPE